MNPPPRSQPQRVRDTLERLAHDVDAWVATADPASGIPYLVPLSFVWDGRTILLATPAGSPTGRNLATTGRARIGIGPTRDVVLVEGSVQTMEPAELSGAEGDTFAEKTGFDPRKLRGYRYFRVTPVLVQAWREANELTGRDLMRDGAWTASAD
jgi:hypothetical protein